MMSWLEVCILLVFSHMLLDSSFSSPEAFEGSQGSHFCPVQKELRA